MMPISEMSIYWFVTGFTMLFPHVINSIGLPKRSHAILRYIVGILLFSAWAFVSPLIPAGAWSAFSVTLLSFAFVIWCCRLSAGMYVYYNVWGLVFYYLAEQLSAVIASLFGRYNEIPFMYGVKVFSIALVTLLQIWILRSIRKKEVEKFLWRQIVMSLLISLLVIIINMTAFNESGRSGLFTFLFQLFSMLTVVLILYMLVMAADSSRRQNEAEFYKFLWRANKKDYDMKKEYLDLINHKYHDMKHEIRALRQMTGAQQSERIDQLEKEIDGFKDLYHTGNEALDTILNDKRRECDKRGIIFTCLVHVEDISFIDLVDLNILLGNLIDNAIEAIVMLPQNQQVINFKLFTEKGFLRIHETNYFSGELYMEQDRLISTKGEDGTYHGFGTGSMKYIVEQYHGEMEIEAEDHIFRLHILIPLPAVYSS